MRDTYKKTDERYREQCALLEETLSPEQKIIFYEIQKLQEDLLSAENENIIKLEKPA